jgi:hypothetical protein
MANPSFYLNAVPHQIDATTVEADVSFITSRGNYLQRKSRYTVASYTLANMYAAVKAACLAIEAAETAIVPVLAAVVPDIAAPYVGKRYDATKASPTLLAPIDTPADSGAPPLAGV